MNKNLLIAIFCGIIVFLPGLTYAATLSLSPSSGSYSLGQIFTVNILLNTQSAAIDGVDIMYLNYNPAYLEVQDENPGTSGIQILAGSLMPMTLANSADVSTGKITFSQITAGGTTFSNNTGQTLAVIRFKVLQTSATSVNFNFTLGSTSDCNVASSGNDILTSVINANYGQGAPLPSSTPTPTLTPTTTPKPKATLTPTPSFIITPTPISPAAASEGEASLAPEEREPTLSPTPVVSQPIISWIKNFSPDIFQIIIIIFIIIVIIAIIFISLQKSE